MTNDPIYLLKPVFNFLDGLIREQGDRLYVVFFYVCLILIGWILGGGLRHRLRAGKHIQPLPHGILICLPLAPPRPASKPPPPLVGHDYERPCCDHEGDCIGTENCTPGATSRNYIPTIRLNLLLLAHYSLGKFGWDDAGWLRENGACSTRPKPGPNGPSTNLAMRGIGVRLKAMNEPVDIRLIEGRQRAEDMRRLAAGEVTPEELDQENSFIRSAADIIHTDFSPKGSPKSWKRILQEIERS